MNTGIYKIMNVINGKLYIGSAIDFQSRLSHHLHSLRKGSHHNEHLQRSWDKHGEYYFEFSLLIICTKNELLYYEQRAIDAFESYSISKGYNICPIAGNTMNRRHSNEAIEKIKAARKYNSFNLLTDRSLSRTKRNPNGQSNHSNSGKANP